jgi:hypothetical protein
VVCLLALVAALVAWALVSGGGGGSGHGSSAPSNTHTPATTITPGPTPSGPHIGGQPGGRDTAPSGTTDGGADGGASSGTSDGSGSGGSGADGGSPAGAASSGGAGTSGGTAGSGGSAAGSGGAAAPGREVPAGSSLPNCSPGSVSLSLSSVRNSYGPGEDPEFRLVAANSGGVACKIDVGPKSAVFTVTGAPGSSHVWASDDCPTTGAHVLQVPANSSISYTLRWTGKSSSPKCAKPKGGQAAPGTYLVQLQMAGYGTHQTSFQISQD